MSGLERSGKNEMEDLDGGVDVGVDDRRRGREWGGREKLEWNKARLEFDETRSFPAVYGIGGTIWNEGMNWRAVMLELWIIGGLSAMRVEGRSLNGSAWVWSNGTENQGGHHRVPRERGGFAPFREILVPRKTYSCAGYKHDPGNTYVWTLLSTKYENCKEPSTVCIRDRHLCLDNVNRKNSIGFGLARPSIKWGTFWRAPYKNEVSQRCGTTEELEDITHPTVETVTGLVIDLLLDCTPKNGQRLNQYCGPLKVIHYYHIAIGEIKSMGLSESDFILNYCVAEVRLVEEGGKYAWKAAFNHRVSRQNMECKNKPYDGEFMGFGDNRWCFRTSFAHEFFKESPFFNEITLDASVMRSGVRRRVKLKRKCGNQLDCLIGYCLRRKEVDGGGDEMRCGNEEEPFDPNDTDDLRRDCFFKTEDGSSLRLSETEWCCRDPDGCATPVGKCTQQSDCLADYCISDGNATRCPSGEEVWWEECWKLRWGETFRLLDKEAWCCIPSDRFTGCDHTRSTAIRSCGNEIFCPSSFCIGETRGIKIKTLCPDQRKAIDRECETLAGDQERRLSPRKVCCKKRECHGQVIACGEDRSCTDEFCVATINSASGRGNVTTQCSAGHLGNEFRSMCLSLSEDETVMIGNNSWCCKASECDGSVTRDSGQTSTSTSSSTSSFNSSTGTAQRKKKLKGLMRYWLTLIILVSGILVLLVVEVVGLGGYAIHLRRKRKRRAALRLKRAGERKTQEFQDISVRVSESGKESNKYETPPESNKDPTMKEASVPKDGHYETPDKSTKEAASSKETKKEEESMDASVTDQLKDTSSTPIPSPSPNNP